jgi:coenzyme F420-0:L-glutamate ligase/coenzyme F420-1:gamma-L-glutamate ligase
MSGGLEVIPVRGLPEVAEGDDLGAMLAGAADLRHGDVLVVTQKVVSKAEGRVVPGPKAAWVARQARRVVARRGDLVVAETAHGFVCASAGVDESNVPLGSVSLLPEDPDASAARIRDAVREATGAEVAVVVSDTFGRPWRRGLVDVAIGVAGMPALVDLRGAPDLYGRPLEVTVVALADQAAAAAGLVMAKAGGIPAAVVRGLAASGQGSGRDVVRPPEEDLFRYGPLEAIESHRTAGAFGPGPVPREVLERAVAAALTTPVPHGSRLDAPSWLWVILESRGAREGVLRRMAEASIRDLHPHELLRGAPVLAVPHLSVESADDPGREADRNASLLATGAAVQRFMLALHAQGYGSAWDSPRPFGTDEAREALGVEAGWLPMGVVACGPPSGVAPPKAPIDPGGSLRFA